MIIFVDYVGANLCVRPRIMQKCGKRAHYRLSYARQGAPLHSSYYIICKIDFRELRRAGIDILKKIWYYS